MSIFKNKQSVTSLRNRSAKNLGIFQKVSEDLIETNEKIDEEITLRKQEVDRLNSERKELRGIQDRNKNALEKLNGFLNIFN